MWPSLLVFVAVATITPGGATTLATVSGTQHGLRRSLPLIAGIALGLASLAAASSLGLGSLLQAFPALNLAMQIAGSAYLLYLAWRVASAGRPNADSKSLRQPISFTGAAALLWLNPKGWAMTLSAAVSFSTLAANPWTLAAILATAFASAAVVSLTLWCLIGRALGQFLRADRHWQIANWTLGGLLALSISALWIE
ncbi:LysE family translocator [Salinisphaera hydrothermalis]|uniref:LysE family translocator n=1 Tax=Salinisphaera hydrothermalis TaxID=563188 RepID=UPI0033411D99